MKKELLCLRFLFNFDIIFLLRQIIPKAMTYFHISLKCLAMETSADLVILACLEQHLESCVRRDDLHYHYFYCRIRKEKTKLSL